MGEAMERFLAFVAYVGGFAAIPFLVKRFTGILGQLTGAINDKSKGVFDKMRNRASEYHQNRRKAIKAERESKRFNNPNTRRSKMLNALERYEHGGSLYDTPGAHNRRKRRKQAKRRVLSTLTGRTLGGSPGSGGEKPSLIPEKSRQERINARFARERTTKIEEEVKALETQFSREELEVVRSVAGAEGTSNLEIQGAIRSLLLTGAPALSHVRELIDMASDNPTLISAFSEVKKSGAFYKDKVSDMAPDLGRINFNTETNKVEKPTPDFATTIPVDSSKKWSISTWRELTGLDWRGGFKGLDENGEEVWDKMDISMPDYSSLEPEERSKIMIARQKNIKRAEELLENPALIRDVRDDVIEYMKKLKGEADKIEPGGYL